MDLIEQLKKEGTALREDCITTMEKALLLKHSFALVTFDPSSVLPGRVMSEMVLHFAPIGTDKEECDRRRIKLAGLLLNLSRELSR